MSDKLQFVVMLPTTPFISSNVRVGYVTTRQTLIGHYSLNRSTLNRQIRIGLPGRIPAFLAAISTC